MQRIKTIPLNRTLTITLVFITIIAAAISGFTYFERKYQYSDATTTLLSLQTYQQQHHFADAKYARSLTKLGMPKTNGRYITPAGHYELILTTMNPTTEYAITAIPIGNQFKDHCTSFAITQQGPDVNTPTKQACWNQSDHL